MENAEKTQRKRCPLRGALAGAVGGLIASYVMNEFQAVLSQAAKKDSSSQQEKSGQDKPDDATEKTANAISTTLTGTPLEKGEKEFYGPVVHYAFGATMGALYGMAAECTPSIRSGFGTLFGSALFVGADGIAVPALGLSQMPTEDFPKGMLSPWLSHLVYGTTVELVRRTFRSIV